MSSDRHYRPEETTPRWALRCAHCKRAMHNRNGGKYGSNACRQAAYRQRIVTDPPAENVTFSRSSAARSRVATNRPAKCNKFAGKTIINGKRFRGKMKGGAA